MILRGNAISLAQIGVDPPLWNQYIAPNKQLGSLSILEQAVRRITVFAVLAQYGVAQKVRGVPTMPNYNYALLGSLSILEQTVIRLTVAVRQRRVPCARRS